MRIQYSIVIPTCNRSEYLEICCKAIREQIQAEKSVEVIVVDDGSEEITAHHNSQICKRFGFTYLYQENKGMAVARNSGVSESKGDWIIFLDDDVLIADNWFGVMRTVLSSQAKTVVGVEGMVEGSGNGVWDREVQNLKGGAFLTCHLAVRGDVLNEISGFDPEFERLGPYCEDHELAARLLKKGEIIFASSLKVTHLPRKVELLKYLITAPKRIRGLLKADLYFYRKHPDQYRHFRHAHTFLGTLLSVLFKNVFKSLRRRNIGRIISNPLQSIVLVIAASIEQLYSWFLLFELLKFNRNLLMNQREQV